MKFEFMEEAVNELCNAMETNPNRFSVGTHTMTDNHTGIEYWTSQNGIIWETWNGRSTNRVFSDPQGCRVWESYQKMREIKASMAQERVLRGMNKTETGVQKDEMPFLLKVVAGLIVFVLIASIFRSVA